MATLTDRDLLIAAGKALMKTSTGREAFGLSIAEALMAISPDGFTHVHAGDDNDFATALANSAAENASLRRDNDDLSALASARLLEITGLEAMVKELRFDLFAARSPKAPNPSEALLAQKDLEIADLRSRLEVVTRDRDQAVLFANEAAQRIETEQSGSAVVLAIAKGGDTVIPADDEQVEGESEAISDEKPAYQPPRPSAPTQLQRVIAAWNDGERDATAISAITGVPKGNVYAAISAAKSRGLIASDPSPSSPGSNSIPASSQRPVGGKGEAVSAQPVAPVMAASPSLQPDLINVVIDFEEEEIEGPNGKSIVVGKPLLDLIDCLKSGRPRHFAYLQTETMMPSRKIRDKVETYRAQLSRIGLEIIIKSDQATLIDLTKDQTP